MIKVGLRGSELSLTQGKLFEAALGQKVEFVVIKTSGDKKQNLTGAIARDKCEWVKEIEEQLLAKSIDIGLHSAKDVPVDIAKGTEINSVLEREDASDLLIGVSSLDELAQGARVGTASARRKAQLLSIRPDLEIVEFRGNVPTRLEKLRKGEVDATILAQAGLNRLGIEVDKSFKLEPPEFLPAVCQGVLAAQYLSENAQAKKLVSSLEEINTELAFIAEREVIRGLEADCSSSVSVLGVVSGQTLLVSSKVFSQDGSKQIFSSLEKDLSNSPKQIAGNLGKELAKELLAKGAKELLAQN